MAVNETHPLTPMEASHIRIMADMQAMFAEMRVNEQRNALVRELDAAILRSAFSPQQVLDLIVEKCLNRTEATHGQVVLYRQGRLVVTASSERFRNGQELQLDHSLCGRAVLSKAEQHIADVGQLPPELYVRYHRETLSELVVLIQPANAARVFGVIDLERNVIGHFSDSAVEFARLLAGQAAIAIDHARVWGGVKTLYDISNAVASGTLSVEQSCREILSTLLSSSDFEHGQILIRESDRLVIVASTRPKDIGLFLLGPDSSVCGRYLLGEGGHSVLTIDDLEQSSYGEVYLGLLGKDGQRMRSEMIIPLISDDGSLIGAINIESPNVGVFTEVDESFFGVVGNFLSGAIAATLARGRRAKEEQMKTAGLALTQLGNAAQTFLHRFGGAIGDARGRLMELEMHLADRGLPPLRVPPISLNDFLRSIMDTLMEAAHTIEDFSERFKPGGTEFQFHNIDLAQVAEDLVSRYRHKHGEAITFFFENSLRVVERNGKKAINSRAICRLTEGITEVVENLLDNAVRAVLEKTDVPSDRVITITLSLTDSLCAQLRVTDTGVGISPRDRQFIFDFGYSTRKSTAASHGIGLWFCRYYTFQVGGSLLWDSTEGLGSWFELQFPTIDG